jgi:polysaccharide biosynthesis/export protein
MRKTIGAAYPTLSEREGCMNKTLRVPLITLLLLGSTIVTSAQSESKSGNTLADVKGNIAYASANRTAPAIPDNAANGEFVIGNGDVLAINVWKEPEVSRVVPVRSDGCISLPLVGEIRASERTPKQLQGEITAKLKDYVSEPEVTVIVQEIKSQKFNVLGMVMKPGSYPLTNATTVLDAIAMTGGFRDFAKRKGIYVLRRLGDGSPIRLPFNYKDVVKGEHSAQNVTLQANDTIVVP